MIDGEGYIVAPERAAALVDRLRGVINMPPIRRPEDFVIAEEDRCPWCSGTGKSPTA